MKINIIDLGSGNVKSIQNTIEKLNVYAKCVSSVSDLDADLIILPGVGEAGSYMKRMRQKSFDKYIVNHVNSGGRVIGICLGFQIMTKYSEESGGVKGLGIINAVTKKIEKNQTHNGWEYIKFKKKKMKGQQFHSSQNLTKKYVLSGRVFYNHEYAVINNDKSAFSLPISNDYSKYTGMFVKDRIIGIQFHPEKSQITGKELFSMIL